MLTQKVVSKPIAHASHRWCYHVGFWRCNSCFQLHGYGDKLLQPTAAARRECPGAPPLVKALQQDTKGHSILVLVDEQHQVLCLCTCCARWGQKRLGARGGKGLGQPCNRPTMDALAPRDRYTLRRVQRQLHPCCTNNNRLLVQIPLAKIGNLADHFSNQAEASHGDLLAEAPWAGGPLAAAQQGQLQVELAPDSA